MVVSRVGRVHRGSPWGPCLPHTQRSDVRLRSSRQLSKLQLDTTIIRAAGALSLRVALGAQRNSQAASAAEAAGIAPRATCRTPRRHDTPTFHQQCMGARASQRTPSAQLSIAHQPATQPTAHGRREASSWGAPLRERSGALERHRASPPVRAPAVLPAGQVHSTRTGRRTPQSVPSSLGLAGLQCLLPLV